MKQYEELPRLLRCVINGAPADRGGADGADAEVQAHWAAAGLRNETVGRGPAAGPASGVYVHDCSTDRRHHPVADRGDHRHRDHRLPRQLALPAILQGGVVRPHRPHGRTRGHRRRRLRAADHPRHHAGQHERAADERGPRQGRCAHHQGPHARRHRRRLLRARRADAGSGRAGRRDARAGAPWSRSGCTRCSPASSSRRCARSPPR